MITPRETCDRTIELADLVDRFTQALQRGERVDWHAVASQHPQHADELLRIGPSLEMLECLGQRHGSSKESPDAAHGPMSLVPMQSLGDFRIVREIGRGGMGVVYEADQLSMGRKVALKVLPFAAIVAEKSLQRFRNEVRAAAALHHAHIVSIFSVGEERGVHFYAMQYIRGQNLAAWVEDVKRWRDNPCLAGVTSASSRRLPDETSPQALLSTILSRPGRDYYRHIAQLGIQAARALQYAHELGIVHRDIKPANLMVDGDHHLFVTDFGLATIEGAQGVTMTGDVVGTLRYMAPEQALGKPAVVDHRADIYSLTATLYELLTLQPPLSGGDRREVLRNIVMQDPEPLRRLDEQIPAELETIVLTGLAKNAPDRYASAQELADDLQRFLDQRPILARRPSTIDRLYKWMRRNPTLTTTALAASTFMMACLLVTTIVVSIAWSERNQATQQAIAERDVSEFRQYVADMRLASRQWQDGEVSAVLQSLHRYDPPLTVAQHRGWEWYFLQSLCHQSLKTLNDHGASVRTVAYSRDGQHLATAGQDRIVRIWDVPSLANPILLTGHAGYITSVTWSPDGRFLATGGQDESVIVWDIQQSKSVRSISLNQTDVQDRICDLAWSPDGETLAVEVEHGERGAEIQFWNTHDWTWRCQTKFDDEHIWSLAWSPDSSRFVSVGNVRLIAWNPLTGEPVHAIERAHRSRIADVAWSHDGKLIATSGNDGHLKIWDTVTWEVKSDVRVSDEHLVALAWSPDDRQLALGSGDTRIHIYDREQSALIRRLAGHTEAVNAVDWCPDGQRIVSGSRDGTVNVWDAHQPVTPIDVGPQEAVALSPRGDRLATYSSTADPKKVILRDAESGRKLRTIAVEDDHLTLITALDWSQDGAYLAAAAANATRTDFTILIWKVDEPQQVRSLPGGERLGLSPDGNRIGICYGDGAFAVLDVESKKELFRCHEEPRFGSAAWSPDGRYLAAQNWNQRVHVWDTLTWREVSVLDLHPDLPVWSVAGDGIIDWSPDGTRLAAGGSRGVAVIWDPFRVHEIHRIRASARRLLTVAWSPDAKRLVTSGHGGRLKMWDTNSGEQVMELVVDDETSVSSVFWNSNQRHLITASDRSVKIWDASLGDRALRQE